MSRQPNGGFIGKENITDNTNASGVYTLSDVTQKVADNEFPTARYTPSRSLRFRRSGAAYLSKTYSTAPTSRTTITHSFWIKLGEVTGPPSIWALFGTVDNWEQISITSPSNGNGWVPNTIRITGPGSAAEIRTTQVFRDPSAWYHIVVVYDTTNAISSERIRLFVNGSRVTSFVSASYPPQNQTTTQWLVSNNQSNIGITGGSTSQTFDGYMAEINVIDGQALTPASFGEYEARTGEWKAKRYAGTYGTNGFYLSFANNSSTSALGLDDGTGLAGSGSGSNDWTTNNFSLTAGATYDSMVDVPGVGSSVINDTGGVTRGNYCTWDPLVAANFNNTGTMGSTIITFSNGNLNTFNSANVGFAPRMQCWSTIGMTTGKWYAEFTNLSNMSVGISKGPIITGSGSGIDSTINYNNGGGFSAVNGAFGTQFGTALSANSGDIIGVTVDLDNNIITWYKNGVEMGGFTSIGTTSTLYETTRPWFFFRAPNSSADSASIIANFGQQPFAYSPPTGFKTLCTTNLPEPDIKRPVDHFDVKLWTGNGTGQTIGNTARERDNYEISRSLRFNPNDSNHLSYTPAVAGNRKTWTWSSWVKRGNLGISGCAIFSAAVNNENAARGIIDFNNTDTLRFGFNDGTTWYIAETTARFRDVSAWYHIVVKCDLSNATQSSRAAIYVNGVQQSTNSVSWVNADQVFNNSVVHTIGRTYSNGALFDGYMAEINFVDGQALEPESFGVFDVDGSWQAKRYTGTYGTNGFYLDFSDNSNTTATTLGKDRAGSNNWTPNNFSVAAGIDNDSMVDVPTNFGGDEVDSGGEVRGNYCVLDSATKGSFVTLSNGGLRIVGNTAENSAVALGTIDVTSGKWYWENTVTTAGGISYIGVGRPNIAWSTLINAETAGDSTNVVYMVRTNGQTFGHPDAKVVSNVGITFATGDVLGLALDMDSGAIYISRNNTWVTSGNPTSGMSKTGAVFSWTPGTETMTPMGGGYNGSVNDFNFGQRAFTYTPPAGFKSLNTKNLNEQSPFVTGPDFVWIKRRNNTSQHVLTDTVRGANRELFSSSTAAEQSNTGQFIQEFTSNGFKLGAGASGTGDVNIAGGTYVSWCWNAGSRTIGNQDGTITSTVRANPEAGFSIVSYVGNGVNNATVGHGLGSTPALIIVKDRTIAYNWDIYHQFLGVNATLTFTLDATRNASAFGTNAPTSTVFSTQNTYTNTSSSNLVAYCWSEVEGYSKFGSYVGNGSADGPFIHTGFRPAFVMIKRTDNTSNWVMWDSERDKTNFADKTIFPNGSSAEETGNVNERWDFLSNGFKLRSNGRVGVSGAIYIYAAFAEQPFKHAVAR